MKRIFLILLLSVTTFANNRNNSSIGLSIMIGGRYDNLRMCVASPAGKKGGPVADVMFNSRFQLSPQTTIGFKLPVMRPILFGLAFKMLQFEPEFILEHTFKLNEKVNFILGPGLGTSFHWGPDYNSDTKTKNRDNFFAAGPFISNLFGFQFKNQKDLNRIVGIRTFYIPLFSKDRSSGTVLGAAFETHFDLHKKP